MSEAQIKTHTTNGEADESTDFNPAMFKREAAVREPDPFDDLDKLRLSQDFTTLTPVRQEITECLVKKPNKQEFVRCRGKEWSFETWTFTEKEGNRETYLIQPHMVDELQGQAQPMLLMLAKSRFGKTPFFWPIPLAMAGATANRWHASAMTAAERSIDAWVRIEADMNAGCYIINIAEGELPPPVWPEALEMRDYLRLAFKGRMIASYEHPVVKALRGVA
ncbi:MAG: hypothetical protein U0836_09205 [Pirellulales bacterium]